MCNYLRRFAAVPCVRESAACACVLMHMVFFFVKKIITKVLTLSAHLSPATHCTCVCVSISILSKHNVNTIGPVEYMPMKHYRACFDVNYFGYINVTQAFLPLLRVRICLT